MSTCCSLTTQIIPHYIMLIIITQSPFSTPPSLFESSFSSSCPIAAHLPPHQTPIPPPPKPCSLPFFSSPQALSGDSAINPSLGRLVLQCLCPALHSLLTDGLKPYQSDLIAGRRPNSAWSLVQASTRAGSISCFIAVDIKNQILSCCSSWGLVSWLIVINSAIRLSPLFSHISQYLLILSSKMLNKVNTRTQILIGLQVPSFTAIFHSLL